MRDDHVLDRVQHFANITGPVIALHGGKHLVTEFDPLQPGATRDDIDEMPRKMRDVLASLGKGRHRQRHHTQPVVEILAKTPFGNFSRQVAAGRRDDPHIDRNLLVAAHPAEPLFGDRSNDLPLRFKRQIADLIEIERSLVRLLEQSDNAAGGADIFGTKQLAIGTLRTEVARSWRR